MTKKLLLGLLLIGFFLFGMRNSYVQAIYHLFAAGRLNPGKGQMPNPRKECEHYVMAYKLKPHLFSYDDVNRADSACGKVNISVKFLKKRRI